MARSRASVTSGRERIGSDGDSSLLRPSTKREALRTLLASRRPTFIWALSTAVSVPGALLHDQ